MGCWGSVKMSLVIGPCVVSECFSVSLIIGSTRRHEKLLHIRQSSGILAARLAVRHAEVAPYTFVQ